MKPPTTSTPNVRRLQARENLPTGACSFLMSHSCGPCRFQNYIPFGPPVSSTVHLPCRIWYTYMYVHDTLPLYLVQPLYMVHLCVWYDLYMVHPCMWYTPVCGTPLYVVHPCIWYTPVWSYIKVTDQVGSDSAGSDSTSPSSLLRVKIQISDLIDSATECDYSHSRCENSTGLYGILCALPALSMSLLS